MVAVLKRLPEAKFLLTIPGVAEVTAATFLGCVGDVRVYESSKQILRLAGLSLVEASSGTRKGRERISKRGRPVLRRYAYLLALRCVRKSGFFRKCATTPKVPQFVNRQIPALGSCGSG
jgi:transposase